MKNKNTKNEKLIANLKKMISQPAMAGDKFTCWRESWMELVKQLENGADYEAALQCLVTRPIKAGGSN